MFYYDVASFNVAEVPEPFNQGFEIGPLFLGTASVPKHSDYRNSSRLLRARRERPRGRAAEQRDEIAAFHYPMPPVLPTERIAHLGTADCCIHPPGRNEMIAITPPKIFSKEVAQKQATPFPRQDSFLPNFRGWRLDENLKPKKSPLPGGPNIARISLRAANGLAARGLV